MTNSSLEERTLTIKEQKFVQYWLESGNGTESIKRAGYKPANDNVAANLAWRLLRKAKIQMTVREEMAVIGLTVEHRYKRLKEILDNADYRTSLEALKLCWELEGRLGKNLIIEKQSTEAMKLEFI